MVRLTIEWFMSEKIINGLDGNRLLKACTFFMREGIRVINACDIGQAASTGEILLLFSKSVAGLLKVPILDWQRLGYYT